MDRDYYGSGKIDSCTSLLIFFVSNNSNYVIYNRSCKPIMTKPKPKPAKPATPETPPTPPPQEGEQPQEDANAGSNDNAGDNGNQVPPVSGEPMETDKSENTGSA
jgi:heat shock 70kDa protein 4